MALRKYNPTSDGRRGMTSQDTAGLSKEKPLKALSSNLKKHAGRNSSGRISVRHQGGGAKRKYRVIDFKRSKDGVKAQVLRLEYDPNRSANIALVEYADGEKSYVIASTEVKTGTTLENGKAAPIRSGNTLQIKDIPIGVMVHNVELHPGKGAQLARSAGTTVKLLAKDGKYATLKLASGETRRILVECRATIGQVSNILHSSVVIGKAGRQRHLGIRPTVRGKVMSPRSHPHGGGEGNNSIGIKHGPKTPWGALALGVKTRSKKNPTGKFILNRRKK
jgi:large subunit ribosomal protein L2